MTVLVTGGTSLLGAAVAGALHAAGEQVRLFQRNPSPAAADQQLGSITDAPAVTRAMHGCSGVIHLAAKVGIVGEWPEYEQVNVDGTWNVIRAAGDAGVERMVHVSTPSVAHTGASLVGAQAEPANPDHAKGHYARSKALAEVMALEANGHGLPVVAIRPHLVWGPGDTQLIERIVDRARSGRLALVGSGAALIDTTWIDNAADAIVAAYARTPEIAGQAFVVSNNEPRTVQEILTRITDAAGAPPPRFSVPAPAARGIGALVERVWDRQQRTDDPPMTRFLAEQLGTAHWFDQRATQEALGWTPRVSLDDGFARLRDWYDAGGDRS